VILDMEECVEVPVLLGRPFLATSRALVDVEMGDLMLRLNDENVSFKVFESMEPYDKKKPQCFQVEVSHATFPNVLTHKKGQSFNHRT
jgi:hypothetical protein